MYGLSDFQFSPLGQAAMLGLFQSLCEEFW